MRFDLKYAIFDNDGTILDSMHYWRLAPLEYMVRNKLPLPEEMTLGALFHNSSRRLAIEVARQAGMDLIEVVRDMERHMERHYMQDVVKKPGIGRFLQALSDGGARMCISTAAPRELCAKAVGRFGLLDHFQFVTDHYEVGLEKSDPEHFRSVARRLGADIGDCWVFEDALYAMRGAKAAGAKVCAIEDYTARAHREEILDLADVYIEDYRKFI